MNHAGFQFRLNSLQYKIKSLAKYLQWSPMKRLLQIVFYGHKTETQMLLSHPNLNNRQKNGLLKEKNCNFRTQNLTNPAAESAR